MKKQGLWFLTLFSLILVLSVYYITMPNELFKTNNSKQEETEEVNKEIEEVTAVSALKVELKEERREKVEELNETINSDSSSSEEKNKAYEELKEIANIEGIEDNIESKLKKDFSVNSCIKVNDNTVEVVVEKDKHDVALANKIMKAVQEEFKDTVSISVKFS